MKTHPKLKYLKYLSVSSIVTITDYALFFSLYIYTSILVAHVVSYSIAIVLSFCLQKKYVFHQGRETKVAFVLVILFSLVGIFLGYVALYFYNYVFGNIVVAKILMSITMLLYNYNSKKFAYGETFFQGFSKTDRT